MPHCANGGTPGNGPTSYPRNPEGHVPLGMERKLLHAIMGALATPAVPKILR